MDRWLFSFITAWTVSAWWPQLPPVAMLPLLFICAITCFLRPGRWVVAGIMIFASIWVASVGHWQHHWQQSLFEHGREHWLTGQISSLVTRGTATRFLFRVERVGDQPQRPAKTLRLKWFKDAPDLRLGQRWRLKARLKPIHGFANDGGVNARQAARAKGIFAQGYVLEPHNAELLDAPFSWRAELSERLHAMHLSEHRWVAALMLGDRRFLTRQDWQLLQHTGTAHLMAISGMHLAIVAGLIFAISGAVLPRLWLIFNPSQQVNLRASMLLLTLFGTLVYAWLSGFALPVQRAWYALVIASIVAQQRISWSASQVLLLVVFFILVSLPGAHAGASLWLSVSAVSAILLCHWRYAGGDKKAPLSGVRNIVSLQWRLMLLLTPVVAIWFGMVSLSGLAANLVAIPVVGLMLVPLCLLALPVLAINQTAAYWVLWLVDGIMGALMQLLGALQSLSLSIIHLPSMPGVVWLFFAVGIGLCFLPRLPVPKPVLWSLFLPVCSYLFPAISPPWRLDVLDVGQGSAAVLSHGRRAMVFDVGAAWEGGSIAKRVLLPFLRARGITRLDTVVISHMDNDHAGGLPELLAAVPVGSVMTPDNGCQTPRTWSWLDVRADVLWPPPGTSLDRNNGSCVVRIAGPGFSILFSGDIERLAETQLVHMYDVKALRADILIAPHHGSRTSSSPAFVQAIRAKHVVFSHGFMHRWNFPAQEVVERYVKAGARLHSTAESGQIAFEFSAHPDTPVRVTHQRKVQ